MKKIYLKLLIILFSLSVFSQTEKYPVFKGCDTIENAQLLTCFKVQLKKAVLAEFKIPENIVSDNYKGSVNIVFLVDRDGKFKVIYMNSPYKELKDEVIRVFNTLPEITPATYNNHQVEMQFVLPLKIPLEDNTSKDFVEENAVIETLEKDPYQLLPSDANPQLTPPQDKALFPEHKSELNIPMVHAVYDSYEFYLNNGTNTHTAVKPYLFSEVGEYVNLDLQKNALLQPRKSWVGRKLWNEHLINVQGKGFWFTVDLAFDLQAGKDSDDLKTFNNTRALKINGGIGKKFNFSTSFYESQGRFAHYFNEYARSIKPAGGNPAIVPGRGIAKEYKSDAFDYPVAEAYLSFTPNKTFNFQFGHGKNFIGNGYRSLFISDVATPYPFFKINTKFWKIKYTNIWMWAQDVRKELTVDGAYKQKYIGLHYLSWNVTKKFNVGLYEAVIWDNANDRGFDVNFLNPLIFYTAIEFATGSRSGNVLLGLNLKYKFNNVALYSQLILDDLRFGEIASGSGWWGNKFGYQFGAKIFNAFKVQNLYLQIEYNSVRPYTFSHDELNYNFGHNNQPLAHLWGSNFKEAIGIIRYTKDRWFINAKAAVGIKGFDFNPSQDPSSYGGNIYRDNDDRVSDYDNTIGQGNKSDIFIGDFQVGYLVNPATNLKLFGSLNYRKFTLSEPTNNLDSSNSTWISFGLKTDLFNWYFDF